MKRQILQGITAVSAIMLAMTQAILPASAEFNDEFEEKEIYYTPDGRILNPYNKGNFDENGGYDPDDKYMQLQAMYDSGVLTPYEAETICAETDYAIYNPYLDPDNPAYYDAGPDIKWEVHNHTLTLTGSGSMYDYNVGSPNWQMFSNVIYHIQLDERIDSIGDYAFNNFLLIQEITLPEGLTRIGNYAFQYCSSLYHVDLPEHLESIGDNAFVYSGLCSLVIPGSVKSLGYMAFSNCGNLSEVRIDEGVESIGGYCFAYCDNLVSCDVPKSVTQIGELIFNNDRYWLRNQKMKGDFIILGDGFLYGTFSEAATLEIPEGVKHIHQHSLDIIFEGEDWGGYSTDNYIAVAVILPESLEDIGPYSMQNMSCLSAVTFQGNNLKSIGDYAFEGDQELQHITLPDSLETIGTRAFANCALLQNLEIPEGVKEIGEDAFWYTPFLADFADDYVILGDGILYYYQGSDKHLVIPDGVKTINSEAMHDKPVISITLPDTVRTIKERAIICSDLEELHLNDGLEVIEDNGILGADYLSSLYVPESLKTFSESSVYRSKLKEIVGSGETAEAFAELYNLPLVETETGYQGTGQDMTLDFETDCWRFANNTQSFGDKYYFTDHDREIIESLPAKESLLKRESWSGACFGMAATVILAKAGAVNADWIQSGAASIHDITPTKQVQSYINYYHNIQNVRSFTSTNVSESATLRLHHLIQKTKHVKDGELPIMVSFQTPDFGHAVIAYAEEEGNWQFKDQNYDARILVWDPNFPNTLNEKSCIYYNTRNYNYCIPHYDVYYNFSGKETSTGRILYICNDVERLNCYPYRFEVSQPAEPIRGDLNNDGNLDVSDAVLLARHCAEDSTVRISSTALLYADLNQDGGLTNDDVISILRIIAKFDAA